MLDANSCCDAAVKRSIDAQIYIGVYYRVKLGAKEQCTRLKLRKTPAGLRGIHLSYVLWLRWGTSGEPLASRIYCPPIVMEVDAWTSYREILSVFILNILELAD